jgi:hypothetical protein
LLYVSYDIIKLFFPCVLNSWQYDTQAFLKEKGFIDFTDGWDLLGAETRDRLVAEFLTWEGNRSKDREFFSENSWLSEVAIYKYISNRSLSIRHKSKQSNDYLFPPKER